MTSEFKFLAVHNWEKYQAQRARHEKWIRSYVHKESDSDFQKLTMFQRALLDGIQRIRGELGSNVPNDPIFIARRLSVIGAERGRVGYAIEALVKRKFLVPTNQQLGFTEEIREEESISTASSNAPSSSETSTQEPLYQLSEDKPPTSERFEIFSRVLENGFEYYKQRIGRTKQYTLTPSRKKQGLARLREIWPTVVEPKEQNAIDILHGLIDELAASDFHMGRDPKTHGSTYCEWENIFRYTEKFQQWMQRWLKEPAA